MPTDVPVPTDLSAPTADLALRGTAVLEQGLVPDALVLCAGERILWAGTAAHAPAGLLPEDDRVLEHDGLILPGLSSAFGVFLMTQYFRAIPKELDEAAILDNASRFRVFWKVLLPLTVPAQATLGIFTFLGAWNDYFWPLISATKKEMFTLTVGIASTQMNFAQSQGIGFLMAQAVFAGAPILIIYLFFQKYIVTAVSGAAVR